jgi:hypothetical protein
LTVSDSTGNWNLAVHRWLKYYIMFRWMDRNKRGAFQIIPTIAVYATSSIWHGPDLGYSIFFFGLAILDVQQRLFLKTTLHERLAMLPHQLTYPLAWLWNYSVLAFFGAGFDNKNLADIRKLYGAYSYLYFWLIPLMILVTAFVLPKKEKKIKDAKKTQ